MTHHHTVRSSHLGFLSGSVFQSTRSSFSREHFGLPHQTGNMKSFRSHYNNIFIRRCKINLREIFTLPETNSSPMKITIFPGFHTIKIVFFPASDLLVYRWLPPENLINGWIPTNIFFSPMFEAKDLHLIEKPAHLRFWYLSGQFIIYTLPETNVCRP